MLGKRANEVFEILRKRILSGELSSKFPSDRALMRRYAISKTTLRKVIGVLAERNIIERRSRSGTYVVDHARNRASGVFGVIMPDLDQPFYATMREGVSNGVRKAGGKAVIVSDLGTGAKAIAQAAERLTELCIAERATGVFLRPLPLVSGRRATARILARFREERIPVVILDGDAAKLPQGTGCDLVAAKGYDNASTEIAALLGDIAFRLMMQRLANPSHPPAEVLLDPPYRERDV